MWFDFYLFSWSLLEGHVFACETIPNFMEIQVRVLLPWWNHRLTLTWDSLWIIASIWETMVAQCPVLWYFYLLLKSHIHWLHFLVYLTFRWLYTCWWDSSPKSLWIYSKFLSKVCSIEKKSHFSFFFQWFSKGNDCIWSKLLSTIKRWFIYFDWFRFWQKYLRKHLNASALFTLFFLKLHWYATRIPGNVMIHNQGGLFVIFGKDEMPWFDFSWNDTEEDFLSQVPHWLDSGAAFIGGCCRFLRLWTILVKRINFIQRVYPENIQQILQFKKTSVIDQNTQ